MPNSGGQPPEDIAANVARLSERTHHMANKMQEMMGKKPPSNTAIIGLGASAVAILVGSITIGSLLFNMGGSVREIQISQNSVAASLARAEAALNAGKDQREKDVARLEGLIRNLDAEQRAQGTRLTRQEVILGIQRGVPQSDEVEPQPAPTRTWPIRQGE